MIRVRVHINEREIIDIHAVREPVFRGMSKHHKYQVYITYGAKSGNLESAHLKIGEISHKYSLGASRLSVRMLQMYYKAMEKMNRAL
jgi:hypothetical protein